MRYRVLVVLASVVMMLPGVLAAQDEETWYFAWKPETGEVVAYTAAGEVNTILEGGVERSFTGWRLDARTVVALLVSVIDREVIAYLLTPESAQPLAFIAHDGKKADMVAFALSHKDVLERYELVATSTTGQILQDKCGLKVQRILSGPLGGDAQIAAQVAEGKIEAVFFLVDPLEKQPHDPDIQGLLRICNVHNVPLATNAATASYIISIRAL